MVATRTQPALTAISATSNAAPLRMAMWDATTLAAAVESLGMVLLRVDDSSGPRVLGCPLIFSS